MPSPFPGMNPFLEQDDAWHDFHERFLPAAAESLGAQVFPDYLVKIDEHVCIHELPDEPRRLVGRADLAVDVERIAFVAICDRRSRELVTVVELLSPANKRPGPDRAQYLAKRNRLLASPAHLVEIDLLRGGPAMPADDRPACDYSVMVSRADDRPQAGFWPIRLRDPLPTVPVPLRPGRDDARLNLAALLHRVYDAAGYALYIYESEPDPPLDPADATWARAILAG